MTPQVRPVAEEVRWEPNAPRACLLSTDEGLVVLALVAHFDDLDQRTVVLRWDDSVASVMSVINDEGLWAHRLYSAGLDRLLWLGVVDGSDWGIGDRASQPSVQHFIAALKECVVEVLAPDVTVARSNDPPSLAVATVASR